MLSLLLFTLLAERMTFVHPFFANRVFGLLQRTRCARTFADRRVFFA